MFGVGVGVGVGGVGGVGVHCSVLCVVYI